MQPAFESTHLQLVGRVVCDGAAASPGPMGQRIFLQAGTFSVGEEGLDQPHNLSLINLPAELLDGPWLLQSYQLWSHPQGGELLLELPLVEPMLIERLLIPGLPPCAVQPTRRRQPLFSISTQARNPCPGWTERIHLYQEPGKPFEASAVLFRDAAGDIAAAELFRVALRYQPPRADSYQRTHCWVQYRY